MTPINEHTAVITSEYNMVHVVEWLRKYTPIAEVKEYYACGGMAQKIYPHCRNERILKVWRYTIPPAPETDNP